MADFATLNFSHTWNGEEILTEIFFKPREGQDNIFDNYRVMNVIHKANIYLPNKLRKILRKYTTCGFAATGGAFVIDDKTIDTTKIKANVEECSETFAETIFETAMKRGVKRDELTGTMIEDILLPTFTEAVASDIARIQWFASDASADLNWSMFDGWLQQAFDSSVSLGHIIDADSTAFETGGALATDGALGLFKNLYDNQGEAMLEFSPEEKRWFVSTPVWNNYLSTLEDTNMTEGWKLVQDGVMRLFFRGTEIVRVKNWTTDLADTSNPQNSIIGTNLIVFTIPDNLIVASDITDPLAQFKIRDADDDDEKLKLIAKFKLGAKIVHESIMAIAY